MRSISQNKFVSYKIFDKISYSKSGLSPCLVLVAGKGATGEDERGLATIFGLCHEMVKSDTKENLDEAAVNLFFMIGTFSLEYNNGKQLTLICENVILSHGH